MPKEKLTQEYLHSILDYSPETGEFYWKWRPDVEYAWNRKFSGKKAGWVKKEQGYWQISIHSKKYYSHRLAWLYMTGSWPANEIDHKDCDKGNNNFLNLREATFIENQRNKAGRKKTKSGLKGVIWCNRKNKWLSRIRGDDKANIHLGSYDCPAAAHFAYIVAADKLHGEFARFS